MSLRLRIWKTCWRGRSKYAGEFKNMRHGFIKAAAMTPKIRVADPVYNAERICEKLKEAYERKAKIIVSGTLYYGLYLSGSVLAGCFAERSADGAAEDCGVYERAGCACLCGAAR